jgi:WD repeat-containing protein 61
VVKKEEKAHNDSVWTVAWKNKYIVTGSTDGKVKCWTEGLEKVSEMNASALSIVSVATTGSVAYSSSMDSHIRAWDIEKGTLLRDVNAGPVDTWAIAVHPKATSLASPSSPASSSSSPFIATTGQSGHVNVWNMEEGTKTQTLETTNAKFSMCVDYSSDGSLLACGSVNGLVSIFDVASQRRRHAIEGHSMCVRAVSFSPDSRTLVSASDDTHLHTFDTETGKPLGVLTGHSGWVLSCRVSPNGKYVASGSADKKLKVWSLQTGECIATLNQHTESVWGVAWNNIGDSLVSVSDDASVVVYRSLEK